MGKESAAVQEMEADVHLISGSGRSSEGHDNPLQCSCLENPRHEGAWCAAIFGVTQSWTRLKRLSSSSSSIHNVFKVENRKIFFSYIPIERTSIRVCLAQG